MKTESVLHHPADLALGHGATDSQCLCGYQGIALLLLYQKRPGLGAVSVGHDQAVSGPGDLGDLFSRNVDVVKLLLRSAPLIRLFDGVSAQGNDQYLFAHPLFSNSINLR
jgi:hypothetical protein